MQCQECNITQCEHTCSFVMLYLIPSHTCYILFWLCQGRLSKINEFDTIEGIIIVLKKFSLSKW